MVRTVPVRFIRLEPEGLRIMLLLCDGPARGRLFVEPEPMSWVMAAIKQERWDERTNPCDFPSETRTEGIL